MIGFRCLTATQRGAGCAPKRAFATSVLWPRESWRAPDWMEKRTTSASWLK